VSSPLLRRSPSTERRSTRAQSIRAWLRHCLGKKRTPISAASEYEDYLFQQWSHGVFEDYWRRGSVRKVSLPMVHLSGWYNPYARTAMENYVCLSRVKKAAAAAHRPQPRLRRGRLTLSHPVADHSVGLVNIQL